MNLLLAPFKPYLYGLLALVVLGAGATLFYYKYQFEKGKADVLKYKHERDNAISLVEAKQKEIELKKQEIEIMENTQNYHLKEISVLKKNKETSDDLLKQALKNNRDWSDSRIPDELRNQFKAIQG